MLPQSSPPHESPVSPQLGSSHPPPLALPLVPEGFGAGFDAGFETCLAGCGLDAGFDDEVAVAATDAKVGFWTEVVLLLALGAAADWDLEDERDDNLEPDRGRLDCGWKNCKGENSNNMKNGNKS